MPGLLPIIAIGFYALGFHAWIHMKLWNTSQVRERSKLLALNLLSAILVALLLCWIAAVRALNLIEGMHIPEILTLLGLLCALSLAWCASALLIVRKREPHPRSQRRPELT